MHSLTRRSLDDTTNFNFNVFGGTVLGAVLLVLALIFDYLVYARTHGTVNSLDYFDHILAAGVVALTLIATLRVQIALLALPVSAVLMTAPAISHLPFLREFGSYVMIGVVLRLLFFMRESGFDACMRAVRSAIGAPILVAFSLYLAISLVPLASLVFYGKAFEAKVLVAGLIYEGFAIMLVLTIATLVFQKGNFVLERLLDGLFGVATAIVVLSVIALPLQFIIKGHVSSIDYLGFYYYCRLKMTFFGPDQYCAFLVLATPLFMLNARRHQGTVRARIATVCLLLIPILLVAGGSRSARLGFALMIIAALPLRDFRRLALGIGAFATLVLVPTTPFRCLSDIPSAYLGTRVLGGVMPFKAFFHDTERYHYLMVVINDAAHSSISSLLFGQGAGLSSYIQFDIGGHSTYLDILVDKGIFGIMIVAAVALGLLRRTVAAWPSWSEAARLRSATLTLMLIPIAITGATYDVRSWLFAWLLVGLLLANTVADETAPTSLPVHAATELSPANDSAANDSVEPATETV